MKKFSCILISLISFSLACEGPQGDAGSPGIQGEQGDPGNTLRFYLQRGGSSLNYTGYADTYISASQADQQFSSEDTLRLSANQRIIIRYDDLLSPLRTASGIDEGNFQVNEAILYLYMEVPAAAELAIYDLHSEALVNLSGASWNNASAEVAWKQAGAGQAISESELISYQRTPGGVSNIVAFYLNPEIVSGWINNNEDNNGVLLTSSSAETARVLSGDYSAQPNLLHYRPLLFLDLQRTNARLAPDASGGYPHWQQGNAERAYRIWQNAPFNR